MKSPLQEVPKDREVSVEVQYSRHGGRVHWSCWWEGLLLGYGNTERGEEAARLDATQFLEDAEIWVGSKIERTLPWTERKS